MEKKYHYVYLTTNLIKGKQYVGDRSCECEPENDPYLGSGTYYNNAERYYGKENFKKVILEKFLTRLEAYNAQAKYIIEHNTLRPNGYNISPTGGFGFNGGYHSEETKKKLSEAAKGEKSSRYIKLSQEQLNEIIKLYTEEHYSITQIQKKLKLNYYKIKNVLILYNIEIQKKPSTKKGKTYEEIYGEESAKKLKKEQSSRIGTNFGKHFSEEHKQKLSESHKGKTTWIKDKQHSQETKDKIQESVKKYWANKRNEKL